METLTAPVVPGSIAIGRIGGVDPRHVVEQFEASGHLAGGHAHLISLRAIHDAFGRRWDDRKSLVWDQAESHIQKRLGDKDFCARVTDDEFLIIMPDLPAAVARGILVTALRDTLARFLGDASHADLKVMTATAFTDGQLECRPLSDGELTEAMQADSVVAARDAPGSSAWRPVDSADSGEGALVSLNGRRLRFSCSVDPIIDLRQWAVAGHRIEPKIVFEDSRAPLSTVAMNDLLPRDLQAIDMTTLQRGLSRLKDGESTAGKPSLILTVSFLTLSNTASRTALVGAASASSLRQAMSKAVIWEITGFDPGLPLGRLKEAVSMIAPFGRSVFARAHASTFQHHKPREANIGGLVYKPGVTYLKTEDAAVWLLAMGRHAKGRAPTLIAANLTSKDLLPIAAEAGFTHATVRS